MQHRRGSTYFLVVSIAMIASVVSMGALVINSSLRRKSELESSYATAGVLAQSAVDFALSEIELNSNWRNDFSANQNDVFSTPIQFGDGSLSWSMSDPIDQDVTDDDSQVVELIGKGERSTSTRLFSVLALPQGRPLDVLRSAVHASGELTIEKELIAGAGPISSDSAVNVMSAYVMGNIESPSIDFPVNVQGYSVDGIPTKTMPSILLYEIYATMATEIPIADLGSSREIKNEYISPSRNPANGGAKNANGIYRIVIPAETTFTIKNCYVEGTLIVQLTGDNSRLKIGDDVVWKPFSPKFPSLVVQAMSDVGTTVELNSVGTLDPTIILTTPALPSTVATQPASLNGLFHVIRDFQTPTSMTKVTAQEPLRGAVVADGPLEILEHSHLIADPLLISQPPFGYTTSPANGQLVTNGKFDAGLGMWSVYDQNAQGHGAQLGLVTSSVVANQQCLQVSERQSVSMGVCQDLTHCLISDESFEFNADIKMNRADESVHIVLETRSETDGLAYYREPVSATTDWDNISATFEPVWSGDLVSARIIVFSSKTTQSFQLDNVQLTDPRSSSTSDLILFPTTWTLKAAN